MRTRASLTLLFFGVALVGSCFSERQDSTTEPGPNDGTHAGCTIPASAQGAGKAVVTIRGYDFAPDTLRVARGTLVTWVNCDNVARTDRHTSTSDTGVWSSPFFAEGETFAFTFGQTGQFPYHCIPHPTMRAVIIVQ